MTNRFFHSCVRLSVMSLPYIDISTQTIGRFKDLINFGFEKFDNNAG